MEKEALRLLSIPAQRTMDNDCECDSISASNHNQCQSDDFYFSQFELMYTFFQDAEYVTSRPVRGRD